MAATKPKAKPKMTVIAEKNVTTETKPFLDPPANAQLAVIPPAPLPNITGETDLIVLASRGELDVDKLKILIDMKNAQADRDAARDFGVALSACQSEMPAVVADAKNTHVGNLYAKMRSITAAIQPVYTKYGFSVVCGEDVANSEGNLLRVYIDVRHRSGHVVRSQGNFPIDTSGSGGKANKTEIQGRGSALTYGERYLTCKFFGVRVVESEENDGEPGVQYATPEQIREINTLIERRNTFQPELDFERFVKWLGVESLDKLDQAGVNKAILELLRVNREKFAEAQRKAQP